MYGLQPGEIQQIRNILACYPQVEEVILYGSRAKGNFRLDSDIDLALKGKELTLTLLFEIDRKLDDLLMPYKTDLSIYHRIQNSDLTHHIDRVGVPFYKKGFIDV